MDNVLEAVILAWAEHAAMPFQGRPMPEAAPQLRMTVTMALDAGKASFPGIDKVAFAYVWSGSDGISVSLEQSEWDENCLVINGGE